MNKKQDNRPAVTQPATPPTDPSATRRRDIAVVGYGLACATGDMDIALYGAVGTRLSAARPDPALEAPAANGVGYEAVITCPATDSGEVQPGHRMTELWLPALEQALAYCDAEDADSGALRVVLFTPPADSARGEDIDTEHWARLARDSLRLPEDTEIHVRALEGSLLAAMAEACDALEAGDCDTLVLGAVDSLLDDVTVQDLALARRLKTTGNADGIVPGEGAAFLVLKNANTIKDIKTIKAYLRALASRPEPHPDTPDRHTPMGLAAAVQACAQANSQDPAALQCIVGTLAQERAGLLEWHHTGRQLWPERLDEEQRQAMLAGELDAPQPVPQPPREILDLAMSIGDTGIAAPLLAMVVAAARFGFRYPPRREMVIIERGDMAQRGAAWLETPREEDTQKARASAA